MVQPHKTKSLEEKSVFRGAINFVPHAQSTNQKHNCQAVHEDGIQEHQYSILHKQQCFTNGQQQYSPFVFSCSNYFALPLFTNVSSKITSSIFTVKLFSPKRYRLSTTFYCATSKKIVILTKVTDNKRQCLLSHPSTFTPPLPNEFQLNLLQE